MRRFAFFVAILSMALSVRLSAQSIHYVAFCNTLDENIGESCGNDFNHVYGMVCNLADALGYEEHLYRYIGEDCSKEKLMEILNGLSCGSEDIVFFYYSGHGVHAAADAANLPQMCLKYEGYQQDKFVPVRVVKEILSKKSSRLNLIVTDCCNNVAEWVTAKRLFADKGKTSPVLRDQDVKNFRKLFFDKRGTVVYTSSKKGQTSGCLLDGGFFTNSFIEMMDYVGTGDIAPDWNQFVDYVKQATLQRSQNKQEPYYEFYFADAAGGSPVTVAPNTNINNQFETPDRARKFFEGLLDNRNTMNDKLAIAENAKEILFSRDAKVRIVGKDMETTIGLEDIDTYLSRVCMSRRIRSVHVIKQAVDRMDRFNYLVVQEIYSE